MGLLMRSLTLPATADEVRDLMSKSSALYGEATAASTADLDLTKVKEAMKKARRRAKGEDDSSDTPLLLQSKKRKYNSSKAEEKVTAEDMEAYRRMKVRHDDPMAKFVDDDADDEDEDERLIASRSIEKTKRKKKKKKKKKRKKVSSDSDGSSD